MEPWRIQRNRAKCEKPGCPLATSGECEFYAVLDVAESLRTDLCAPCFRERVAADEDPIYWKVRRRAKQGSVLDLASLRQLFDRLGEEKELGAEAGVAVADLRYLVALLLLRKRLLKLVDPRDEAEEAADLLVVDPKVEGMEPVALNGPELTPERLDALKLELVAVLESSDPATA